VDLAWLQETIELPKKANLIVAGESRANAQEWLRSAWTLEDLGLVIRAPEGRGVVQVQSERIYLDPAVSAPAVALRPDGAAVALLPGEPADGRQRQGDAYSFVTAISPGTDPRSRPSRRA